MFLLRWVPMPPFASRSRAHSSNEALYKKEGLTLGLTDLVCGDLSFVGPGSWRAQEIPKVLVGFWPHPDNHKKNFRFKKCPMSCSDQVTSYLCPHRTPKGDEGEATRRHGKGSSFFHRAFSTGRFSAGQTKWNFFSRIVTNRSLHHKSSNSSFSSGGGSSPSWSKKKREREWKLWKLMNLNLTHNKLSSKACIFLRRWRKDPNPLRRRSKPTSMHKRSNWEIYGNFCVPSNLSSVRVPTREKKTRDSDP